MNPCNQKPSFKACTSTDNKRRHDSHYQDNHYTSSNNGSFGSDNTPMPSKGKASVSGRSKEEENYDLGYDGKIPQNKGRLMCPLTLREMKKMQTLIWDGMTRLKMLISMTS
jgi:hypothetical protein